jgi:hypothetical protein
MNRLPEALGGLPPRATLGKTLNVLVDRARAGKARVLSNTSKEGL